MDDDTISRQAAYEVLTAYYHHATDVQHAALHDALSKVPSAERHGRWIAIENDIDYYPFMCSECYETVIKRTNYCPNCGAKMDEVTE